MAFKKHHVLKWHERLANVHDVPYEHMRVRGREMLLERMNPETCVQYDLLVRVDGCFYKGEDGDAWSPSYPDEWEDVWAAYYRHGRGWKFLELSEKDIEQIIDFLET